MKKYFWLILLSIFFLFAFSAGKAVAAPSPLSRVSSGAKINEDSTVSIISYKTDLHVESGFTSVRVSLVLKNLNEEGREDVTIGIPSHLNNGNIEIEALEVIMDGKRQRLTTRRNRTNENESNYSDLPRNWYTWNIRLQPGEYKVIDFSYQYENSADENGTKMIYVPLEFIKAWVDMPRNVELTVYVKDGQPYQLEPNPSVLPHEYDGFSRLSWRYNNTSVPDNIQVYLRFTEELAVTALERSENINRTISDILAAFKNKSYDEAISRIDQYLEEESEPLLKNELEYLKALSHQGLYQTDEAAAIFSRLERKPFFGGLEETFQNRIIYEKYNYMKKTLADDKDIYDYLDTAREYIMENTIFLMWVEERMAEIESSDALLEPEPDPAETEETEETPVETPSSDDEEEELVKSINIAGYEVPVEIVFLAAVLLIILIFLLRGRKRKKEGRYLFR